MTNQNICTIPAEHLLSSHLYGLAKIKFLKKKKNSIAMKTTVKGDSIVYTLC